MSIGRRMFGGLLGAGAALGPKALNEAISAEVPNRAASGVTMRYGRISGVSDACAGFASDNTKALDIYGNPVIRRLLTRNSYMSDFVNDMGHHPAVLNNKSNAAWFKRMVNLRKAQERHHAFETAVQLLREAWGEAE